MCRAETDGMLIADLRFNTDDLERLGLPKQTDGGLLDQH